MAILLFPLILRFLGDHFDFFRRVIEMDALSYYGVAFGLFASYLTYIADKREKDKTELQRITPIITFDICKVGELAYIATIANRGETLQQNLYLDGDQIAADIQAGEKLHINITLDGCGHTFGNNYKTVQISEDNGKLPQMLLIHCTDNVRRMWCHVFTRFEDFNGVHYNLTKREIECDDIAL